MGNRSSTVQPTAPPALLSAAVMGDLEKFQAAWNATNKNDNGDFVQEKERCVTDRQQNNVLHALFSCRVAGRNCVEILNVIHESMADAGDTTNEQGLSKLYTAQNNLGCTPLWILVAYGNVALLKHVQSKLEHTNHEVSELILVPNHQGDTSFLATCSQGNTDMVRYLKENVLSPQQFTSLLSQENKKGTSPLQIVIGNGHLDLLQYLLSESSSLPQMHESILQTNAAGLSLFHICSERNFHQGLRLLLEHMMDENDAGTPSSVQALEQVLAIKDKNGANAIHVASFCGNEEAVQVWVDVIQKATTSSNSDTNDNGKRTTTAADLLDQMDNQARTPYWLAMVQGHETIGKILAAHAGVDTTHPKMVQEIEQAQQRRAEQRNNNAMRPVDGAALLGRR